MELLQRLEDNTLPRESPPRIENPTSIQRRTFVEQWVHTLMKGGVLLGPAAWFRFLGRSLLKMAAAVTCAFRKRPRLEDEATQHRAAA